ncbi:hypothetical protein DFH11DRAFT_901364 [Phellopilus nigrolimitatus]|nr:hypothetical protein DFH11DRAFT_901364 [Phellopilus nigrolimitatus]
MVKHTLASYLSFFVFAFSFYPLLNCHYNVKNSYCAKKYQIRALCICQNIMVTEYINSAYILLIQLATLHQGRMSMGRASSPGQPTHAVDAKDSEKHK